MNPTHLSITILMISVIAAFSLFKTNFFSLMSFIMILAFSSGMMTLFIYAATMTPNEKSKFPKKKALMLILVITMSLPNKSETSILKENKNFSSKATFLLMLTILISTMLAIATHGFNPQQSISAAF